MREMSPAQVQRTPPRPDDLPLRITHHRSRADAPWRRDGAVSPERRAEPSQTFLPDDAYRYPYATHPSGLGGRTGRPEGCVDTLPLRGDRVSPTARVRRHGSGPVRRSREGRERSIRVPDFGNVEQLVGEHGDLEDPSDGLRCRGHAERAIGLRELLAGDRSCFDNPSP